MSLKTIVKLALTEDRAFNDITSDLTITKNHKISFKIAARQDIVFCGKKIISEVFLQLKNYKKFKNSKIL